MRWPTRPTSPGSRSPCRRTISTGLRVVRDALDVDVAAGEYGYDEPYFARMVAAGAVDCLQIDVTRCGGYTSWLRAAAVAGAQGLDVSAHCAPNLHAHVGRRACPICATSSTSMIITASKRCCSTVRSIPRAGAFGRTSMCPGHGMALKESAAAPYRR